MYKVGDSVLCRCKVIGVDKTHSWQHYEVELRDSRGTGKTYLWVSDEDIQDNSSTIICDPNSPEAKALIGKAVATADAYAALVDVEALDLRKRILVSIIPTDAYPFRTEGDSGWKFIRAIPEKPVKKMTVAQVCKELGYDVEIVKDE